MKKRNIGISITIAIFVGLFIWDAVVPDVKQTETGIILTSFPVLPVGHSEWKKTEVTCYGTALRSILYTKKIDDVGTQIVEKVYLNNDLIKVRYSIEDASTKLTVDDNIWVFSKDRWRHFYDRDLSNNRFVFDLYVDEVASMIGTLDVPEKTTHIGTKKCSLSLDFASNS